MKAKFWILMPAIIVSGLSAAPLRAAARDAGEHDIGSGGDAYAEAFTQTGRHLIDVLKRHPLAGVDPTGLEAAVLTTLVTSQDELVLGDRPVDAINYPAAKPPRIVVSRSGWDRLADQERQRSVLVFHEYLGILGIDDSRYQMSSLLDETHVCDRTNAVKFALMSALQKDCEEISATDLAKIHSLDLSKRNIAALKSDDLAGLSSLDELDLRDNQLTEIPRGFYDGTALTQYVSLDGNPIPVLDDSTLPHAGQTQIDVGWTGFRELRAGAFSGMRLEYLGLGHSFFEKIEPGAFAGLTLQGLGISVDFAKASDQFLGELGGIRSLTLRSGTYESLRPKSLLALDKLLSLELEDGPIELPVAGPLFEAIDEHPSLSDLSLYSLDVGRGLRPLDRELDEFHLRRQAAEARRVYQMPAKEIRKADSMFIPSVRSKSGVTGLIVSGLLISYASASRIDRVYAGTASPAPGESQFIAWVADADAAKKDILDRFSAANGGKWEATNPARSVNSAGFVTRAQLAAGTAVTASPPIPEKQALTSARDFLRKNLSFFGLADSDLDQIPPQQTQSFRDGFEITWRGRTPASPFLDQPFLANDVFITIGVSTGGSVSSIDNQSDLAPTALLKLPAEMAPGSPYAEVVTKTLFSTDLVFEGFDGKPVSAGVVKPADVKEVRYVIFPQGFARLGGGFQPSPPGGELYWAAFEARVCAGGDPGQCFKVYVSAISGILISINPEFQT